MLNFLKNGIFSRTDAEDAQNNMQDSGQERSGVLAVWGSPGSGKSTAAVKIAKHLAEKKKNVLLLLCDMTAPMVPCICPSSELECERSLGSILAATHVSGALVRHNCVTHKRLGHLLLLGMQKGENEYTYPPYSEVQATELIARIRELAPFVVIDCGSYIANDIFSAVALMEADSVLRLGNCDLKTVSYFSSQLPLLKDYKLKADKQKCVCKTAKRKRSEQFKRFAHSLFRSSSSLILSFKVVSTKFENVRF